METRKMVLFLSLAILLLPLLASATWLAAQAAGTGTCLYPEASANGAIADTGTVNVAPGSFVATCYFTDTGTVNLSGFRAQAYTWKQGTAVEIDGANLSSADVAMAGAMQSSIQINFTGGETNGVGFRVIGPGTETGTGINVTEVVYRPAPGPLQLDDLVNVEDLLYISFLAVALAALCALWSAYRSGRLSTLFAWLGRVPAWQLIFVAVFAVNVMVIATYLAAGWLLPPSDGYLPVVSGDEPHYLIIAQSLLQDHDIFLQNQYASDSYASFFHYSLDNSLGEQTVKDLYGNLLSIHGIGMPALLAVPFALGGVTGAKLALAAFAAGTAAVLYVLLEQTGFSRSTSLLTVAAIALTVPFFFYGTVIYTEIIALFVITLATWLLADLIQSRQPSAAKSLAVGLGLAFLPWLGAKYVVFTVAFAALYGCYYMKKRPGTRQLLAMAVPVLIGLLLFEGFLYHEFGSLDPIKVYVGTGSSGPVEVSYGTGQGQGTGLAADLLAEARAMFNFDAGHLLSSLLNRFLDRDNGIFFYAPVLVLAVAGLAAVARGSAGRPGRTEVLVLCLPPLAFLLMYASTDSVGGFCPPARTVMPLMAAIAILLGAGIDLIFRRGLAAVYLLLMSLSLAMTAFLLANPHVTYAHDVTGLLSTPLIDISVLFPSLASAGPGVQALVSMTFWTALGAMLAVLCIIARQSQREASDNTKPEKE